jgi:hypothetical protein
VDTIIGPLGAGEAEEGAYRFAGELLGALAAGNRGAPALSSIEGGALDTILEGLKAINPASCRLGGGREEADGAVSFLVRFIGREKAISGELYIRTGGDGPAADGEAAEEALPAEAGNGSAAAGDGAAGEALPAGAGNGSAAAGDGAAEAGDGGEKSAGKVLWRFDDLVLEEPGDRGGPAEEGRYDFVPYERFF